MPRMTREEFAEKLTTLKASAPRYATPSDIGLTIALKDDGEPVTDADRWNVACTDAAACAYLSKFLPPDDGCHCPICGVTLGGLMGALTGGFTWGLVHGEGYCATCGYPGRAVHEIPAVGRISGMILMYHPSGLELREPEQASAE